MTTLSIRFVAGAGSPGMREIKFTNDLGDIERVNEAFEEFASRQKLSDRVRRSIKLVFDELLNNIISYAFDDVWPYPRRRLGRYAGTALRAVTLNSAS